MTIVERILQARVAHLDAGHPIPNQCRLSPAAAHEFREWVEQIEKDPIIGHVDSHLKDHCFGMDIFEDADVVDIVVGFVSR